MKKNVFTNVNLTLLFLGYIMGVHTKLWKMSCCNAFGSTACFSCAPLFDSTVFERQREKNNLTILVFYTGHIVLHIFPCIFILYKFQGAIDTFTCTIAFGIKVLWAYLTCGSIYLDTIYVPMEKRVWQKLWAISFSFHFFPFFYFKL